MKTSYGETSNELEKNLASECWEPPQGLGKSGQLIVEWAPDKPIDLDHTLDVTMDGSHKVNTFKLFRREGCCGGRAELILKIGGKKCEMECSNHEEVV